MTEKVLEIMQMAEEDPAAAARLLRSLMLAEPQHFLRATAALLKDQAATRGSEEIMKLLSSSDRALKALCDPNLFSKEVSVQLVRRMANTDRQLDTKLLRLLPRRDGSTSELIPLDTIERTLELLDAASKCGRIIPALTHFLQDENPRLRAKATLLIGRRVQNTQLVTTQLQEGDARVRASAVESLWGDKTPAAINVLWNAAADRNNRVVGNALLGLYRAQDNRAIPRILKMAQDPAPLFRATAAWVIGQTSDARFRPALEKLTRDLYASVRKNAAKSLALMDGSTGTPDNLRLHVLKFNATQDEYRSLWIRVSGPDGETMRGLLHSQFVLWNGQSLVTDYEVVEHDTRENVVCGLALCRDGAAEAATAVLDNKGPQQLWAIARVQSAGGEHEEILPAAFQADPVKLQAALAKPPVKVAASETIGAMKSLLPSIVQIPGSRHLILFPENSFDSSIEMEQHVVTALRNKVAIHAIAAGAAADSLKVACEKTGGILLTTRPDADLAAEFQQLYSALSGYYRLQYRADPSEESATGMLRVQVYSGEGRGECSIPVADATPSLVSAL